MKILYFPDNLHEGKNISNPGRFSLLAFYFFFKLIAIQAMTPDLLIVHVAVMEVSISRLAFAGLGLVSVSGLEILVLVSVLCSQGLGLAQSNLSRPLRPQKFRLK